MLQTRHYLLYISETSKISLVSLAFLVGQIDNLYKRFVHYLIPKGESSGQNVENFGVNASAFC